MDYLLFANVFFYIAMLRGFDKFSWGIVKCSVVVGLVPFMFALIIRWILSGYSWDIVGLVTTADVITVLLRAFVAAAIFYKIRQSESTVSYFAWGVVGIIVLFYFIPGVVSLLIKI